MAERLEVELVPTVPESAVGNLSHMLATHLAEEMWNEFEKKAKQQESKGTNSGTGAGAGGGGSSDKIARAVAGGLRDAGSVARQAMGGNLGGALQGGLSMAGPWGMAASAGIGVVSGAFSGMMESVGKFNPALVEQIGMAFDDIQAVIGQTLAPVLKVFLPLLRSWGDFIASIVPSTEQMDEAMTPLKEAFDEFSKYLQEIAPLIKDGLVMSLTQLGMTLKTLAEIFEFLMRTSRATIALFTGNLKGAGEALFGESGKGFEKSSRNLAARQAGFTSLEGLGDQLRQAAFSLGTGESPEQQTANNTHRIANGIDALNQKAGNVPQPAMAGVGGGGAF